MTTLAEKIAVMQAFDRGEKVERRLHGGKYWVESNTPSWNWFAGEYRIAPKPIDLVEVLTKLGKGIVLTACAGHSWADIIARAEELQAGGGK